ncbi:interleukin-23 subunit alpha isoform X1 [Pezoporus flaviventris]|uniref:interleukin-23 subunit alpha isoform X1 n=1 Tax=Pezoporus flaviventris TaxID=889875 RepID=UPI002AB0AF6A|nr:interleukin-23 subunit alpha isoform X1 [Pezoporus flaviventris]
MDPLRRLCLPLLLLLLPPAAPAPAPVPGPNWAACKSLSRELSGLVATLKEPHGVLEDTHLSEEDPKNWPPRIRCSDACDPSNLDTNNTRCLHRILQGLQHYRDLLSSDIFTARRLPPLEAALEQLLGLVQVRGWGPGPPPGAPAPHQPLNAAVPTEGARPPAPAPHGPQRSLGSAAAAAPGAPAPPVLQHHHEPRLHPQRRPPLRPGGGARLFIPLRRGYLCAVGRYLSRVFMGCE